MSFISSCIIHTIIIIPSFSTCYKTHTCYTAASFYLNSYFSRKPNEEKLIFLFYTVTISEILYFFTYNHASISNHLFFYLENFFYIFLKDGSAGDEFFSFYLQKSFNRSMDHLEKGC